MADEGAVSAGSAPAEWPTVTAISLTGTIKVRTTEQGLPVALRVDPSELHRDPAHLANEVLRLCQRAANRAGLAKRKQLEEAGASAATLALTGLPTEAEVRQLEQAEELDYDMEPRSWLRTL
ncbi:hypothetical protein HLB23_18820 [Nocardia uniformis]|uniref:Uncharacterized protein n=1 Tax=Nocardia uniformis TaxID=53432 RepID=A0A849C6B3_9NOCA|nr:hypothetical protein [Nocardia uniformis]NNH71885.1 hypothetical protein [Nocardia uniformis]